ncbi:MAG: putative metal-binding motif-containing protein, partial [Flavobacteriales bacterium]|nr:putative metal-binding motif-containing protein [Flavobacteriales bacterium]
SGNWFVTCAANTAVNNYGTINIISDGEIGPVYFGSSTYFVNHASGVINKSGSPSDETQFSAFNNSTGNFVTNQGTININSGKLNFTKEFNNSGSIYVGAGAMLRLSGTEFNANFGAGTLFTGTGIIRVEKYLNNFSTTGFWIQEDLVITSNTFDFASGLVSGTTGKQLIFEGTSTVNWTGGIFSLGIHVINNSANFNMMSSSHGLCQNFTNNGTLNWSGGDIVNGYFAAGTGSPVVSIVNNGTWNINTDADVSSGPAGNGNTITFDNGLNGVINKNGTAGQYTELSGAFFTFNNSGTIHILTGNLSFGGTLNQYNTVSVSSVSKFRYLGGGADVSNIFRLYSTSQFPGSGDIEIVGGYPIVVPISPVNLSGHNVLFDTYNGKIYGGAMTIENGTFTWASGGLNGVILSIDASATLITMSVTSNPSPGRIMSENTTVINDGIWNWIDGDIIGTSPFSIGSDQNNVENNGTWNINCTAGDYLVVNYTTSTVTNNGTIYGQTEFTTAGATPPANLTFVNYGDIFEGPCGFISLPNSITSFGAFGQFCAGASFDVSFTSDLVFLGGNIFTVQLSSSTGSFSSPVAIGALASSGSSGVINATIPPGTTPGTGYRLRVVSSNPGYIGIDNGSDIVIGSMVTHYADSDGDGYGDPDSPQEIDTCFPVPAGYVLNADDCDDNDPSVNPFGSEICNGIDDNCDGTTDEGFDTDDDGYTTCEGDCDDTYGNIYPGAPEICDGIDQDCDGSIDEDFDIDLDNYTTCEGDCDDNDASVNPGMTEICNGIDDNCNGSIDEGFDLDGDGYTICNGDCDDSLSDVNPGTDEVCNGIDDDCDGSVDEGFDIDNDGYTTCQNDCNDNDPSIFPGAVEILCNGIDDNCNGTIDEGRVNGCMNPAACNYDPAATCDDGSCLVDYGCTNAAACNYDPAATCDDGSCLVDYGCMNPAACNYDPAATCDDGSCLVDYGCTNAAACNYDPAATCDDGSCLIDYGCMNPAACNFDPSATCDDGSCLIDYGCMNPAACNFDPAATCDDGTCLIDYGCMNPAACNFDPAATCDDGSCLVDYGCTNAAACNYDPAATCDDGSCLVDYGCTNATACNYDPAATCDDGSCLVDYGCTNPLAVNFDPSATCEDGSCHFNGCTYANANNYNALALVDDGTCIWLGCTNPLSINYNAMATVDDGNCVIPVYGCTYAGAENFNPLATHDDGSCLCPEVCPGDIDGNGVINISDLLGFMGVFGTSCN